MKKFKFYFLATLFVILGFGFFTIYLYEKKLTQKIPSSQKNEGSYFNEIPLSKFNLADLPCLLVEIEGLEANAILDLGFKGAFCLYKEFLDRVENKEFLYTCPMYNFKGIYHERIVYKIPRIKVGPLTFSEAHFQESSEEEASETRFILEGDVSPGGSLGRIGWETFRNTNLFLDLGNSKLAYSDSIESIQANGYSHLKFIKTPLLTERGLIECLIKLDENEVRCVLDTGSTWNILNKDLPEEVNLHTAMLDDKGFMQTQMLDVEGQDFGLVAFKPIPIKLPIHLDAILGMEFFQSHCVFIDFAEKMLYFAKNIE